MQNMQGKQVATQALLSYGNLTCYMTRFCHFWHEFGQNMFYNIIFWHIFLHISYFSMIFASEIDENNVF